MFASLAHHLGAPSVSFDGHEAHWAGLDVALKVHDVKGGGVVPVAVHAALLDQSLAVLLAGFAGVPVARALGAELLAAGRALGGGTDVGVLGVGVTDVADGLTVRNRTPSTITIKRHLCKINNINIHIFMLKKYDFYVLSIVIISFLELLSKRNLHQLNFQCFKLISN